LLEATGEGHCALPVDLLKETAGKLLLVDEKIVIQALERTLANGDVVQENIAGQELLFRIRLGEQTGADRAALDWAIAHSVPHGGWCPKGRRAEAGPRAD
jgi:hypothetical protein